MNPTLYLAGTRLSRIVLFAFVPMMALIGLMRAPLVAITERETFWVASWIVVPLMLGWIVNSLVLETLHRNFAMTLPNAARKILGGHALVTLLVATMCAAAVKLPVPDLPYIPMMALAAAAFSSSLVYEEGRNEWVGYVVAGLIWVVVFFDLPVGWAIQRGIESAPWGFTLVAMAFATACFVATFSKEGRRGRAVTPYTSVFNAAFSAPLMRQRNSQAQARKDFSRKTWSTKAPADSLQWWLSALRFERGNEFGRVSGLGMIALGTLASFVALWLPALLTRQTGTTTEKLFAAFGSHASGTANSLGMILVIQPLLMAIPRCQFLYPCSRARRFAIARYSMVVQQAVGCFTVAVGAGLVGATAAFIEGKSFPWDGYLGLMATVSTMLIFTPLVLWGRMQLEVRDSRFILVATMIAALVFGPIMRQWVWGDAAKWAGGAVPLDRLAAGVALIALSQFVGYLALRRFFLRADLVQR